jgi:hypothetical protein
MAANPWRRFPAGSRLKANDLIRRSSGNGGGVAAAVIAGAFFEPPAGVFGIDANSDSFSVTGADAVFTPIEPLYADPEAYTVTGEPLTLVYQPVGSHRYWRIVIRRGLSGIDPVGNQFFAGSTEIQFRETIGVAQTNTGGIPTASSTSSGAVANLFDSNVGNQNWFISQIPPFSTSPAWVQYDFGVNDPKNIAEVALSSFNSGVNGSIADFDLEWSDDGAAWTNKFSVIDFTGWDSFTQLKTYSATTPAVAAKRRYRVLVNAQPGFVTFVEIEMRGTVGGANLVAGGDGITDHQNATQYTPSKPFDGNTNLSIQWIADMNSTARHWIGYEFPAAVDIAEISILSAAAATFPISFSWDYWNGTAWVSLDTFSAQTATTGVANVYSVSAVPAAPEEIDAGPGAFSVTGSPATLSRDVFVNADPGFAFFNVVGFAAQTLHAPAITAEPTSFALSGVAATGVRDFPLVCAATAYALAGSAASLVATIVAPVLDSAPGAYSVTGASATTTKAVNLDSAPGAYSVTGSPAALAFAFTLPASPTAFTLAGAAASVTHEYINNGTPAAAYSITGAAATALREVTLGASPASFIVTGAPATAIRDVSGTTSPGAYSVTGATASANLTSTATPGAYSVAGAAADLSAQIIGFIFLPGEYLVTGFETVVYRGDAVLADAGLFTYTGADAGFARTYSVLGFPAGTYSITGADATTAKSSILSASPTSFTVTGAAANLHRDVSGTTSPGAYSVTGAAASIARTQFASLDPGTYLFATYPANFYLDLPALPAAFAITGAAAELARSPATLAAFAGVLEVSGNNSSVVIGFAGLPPGDYAITGADLTAEIRIGVSAESGSYTVIGAEAIMRIGSQVFETASGIYSIAGAPTSFTKILYLPGQGAKPADSEGRTQSAARDLPPGSPRDAAVQTDLRLKSPTPTRQTSAQAGTRGASIQRR